MPTLPTSTPHTVSSEMADSVPPATQATEQMADQQTSGEPANTGSNGNPQSHSPKSRSQRQPKTSFTSLDPSFHRLNHPIYQADCPEIDFHYRLSEFWFPDPREDRKEVPDYDGLIIREEDRAPLEDLRLCLLAIRGDVISYHYECDKLIELQVELDNALWGKIVPATSLTPSSAIVSIGELLLKHVASLPWGKQIKSFAATGKYTYEGQRTTARIFVESTYRYLLMFKITWTLLVEFGKALNRVRAFRARIDGTMRLMRNGLRPRAGHLSIDTLQIEYEEGLNKVEKFYASGFTDVIGYVDFFQELYAPTTTGWASNVCSLIAKLNLSLEPLNASVVNPCSLPHIQGSTVLELHHMRIDSTHSIFTDLGWVLDLAPLQPSDNVKKKSTASLELESPGCTVDGSAPIRTRIENRKGQRLERLVPEIDGLFAHQIGKGSLSAALYNGSLPLIFVRQSKIANFV
ncbi:hypothetical protein ABW21_db0204635 [Orbilia brochopaga]|nr:hypothetical protein ABW21_db0204635 [Drechslerella brochopaga]